MKHCRELYCAGVKKDTVLQRDVILENGVPLLQDNFVPSRPRLRSDQLLQVSNSVVAIALDADLFSQPVIACNLDHFLLIKGDPYVSERKITFS